MSKITEPMMLDSTGKALVEKLHTQNLLLNVMANSAIEVASSLEEIHRIVQTGNAAKVFNIGDQLILPWTDKATGTTYQYPFDVVHFGKVNIEDGEELPAMFLQAHYATPFGVQFDNFEAFYFASDEGGLKPGSYKIAFAGTWGTHVKAKTYKFTLTKPVPQNGVLAGFERCPDVDPTSWRVSSYAKASDKDPIETVSVTEVSSGDPSTDLGTLKIGAEKFNAEAKLNDLHRVGYGYNRWSMSAMRQWLNSTADKDKWWASKNQFDRPPAELATKAGFMSGFNSDFLATLKPVKVQTALNTVTDDQIVCIPEHLETTYDTFFLPCLDNMNITPQLAGEGDVFEYWKRASKSAEKLAQYGTYPRMRTFALENHTSPQSVRLRSAGRGFGSITWYVNSSGYVNGNYAYGSFRCTPVCAMC